MNEEIEEMMDNVLLILSKNGSKPAKILLLQSNYREIEKEIIEKYCLKEEVYEAKQDIVINFLEQIILLAKELKSELDK